MDTAQTPKLRLDSPSLLHDIPKFRFSFSWLVIVPAGAWGISTIYIPLFSENLGRLNNWAVTATILLVVGLSVLGHIIAHAVAARLVDAPRPEALQVAIYGDTAQAWPLAGTAWKEAAVAAAGPFANLLLSGLAYWLWNAQIGIFPNLVALLICLFNLWVFATNLLPGYPADGGRILRLALLSLSIPPEVPSRWTRRLGFVACLALTGWSAFLYIQHSRFSLETAGITLALALLLLDGLRPRPASEAPTAAAPIPQLRPVRLAAMLLLALIMLAAFAATWMTNNGLDAPGVALSVEPMVNVPPPYHHSHAGTFLLTTVFSHAPILAGEWLLSRVDRAMTILPPEQVVPKNTTIQEQARQGYQQLDESEATAITVGLRLAGYPTEMAGKGVQVASISPQSHANGILQPGDVITALNGQPVRTTDDLIRLVKAQSATTPVLLEVQRGQGQMTATVPLLPPDSSSSTPHIGISIQSAGFNFRTPFPVSIQTQKISGGPSAGLMFTLTLYNALSPKDLTGGRKIAGTGTMSLDGTIGPIGGVKQKVAAAEATGARYFLCPVENYADAVSVARTIQVIEVSNVQDALHFLNSLPPQQP